MAVDHSIINIILADDINEQELEQLIVNAGSSVIAKYNFVGSWTISCTDEIAYDLMGVLHKSPLVQFAEFPIIRTPNVYSLNDFTTTIPVTSAPYDYEHSTSVQGFTFINYGFGVDTSMIFNSATVASGTGFSGKDLRIVGGSGEDWDENFLGVSGFKLTKTYTGPFIPAVLSLKYKGSLSLSSYTTLITLNGSNPDSPLIFDDTWRTASFTFQEVAALDLLISCYTPEGAMVFPILDIDSIELSVVAPGRPVLNVVSGIGTNTISWPQISGALSYNLYYTDNGTIPTRSSTKITAASSPFLHSGLSNGIVYIYVAESETADSTSFLSDPKAGKPNKPSVVVPYSPSSIFYEDYQKAGFEQLNIPRAWTVTRGHTGYASPNPGVMVTDSGLDTGHPHFADKIDWHWNLSNGSLLVNDTGVHGTMVSGVFAKELPDGIIGVAPDAIFHASIIAGLTSSVDWAIANPNKAKIISVSWGGGPAAPTYVTQASYNSFYFNAANIDVADDYNQLLPLNQVIVVDDPIANKYQSGKITGSVYAAGKITFTVLWEDPAYTYGTFEFIQIVFMSEEVPTNRAWDAGVIVCSAAGNEFSRYIPLQYTTKGVQVAAAGADDNLHNFSNRGYGITITATAETILTTGPRTGHGSPMGNVVDNVNVPITFDVFISTTAGSKEATVVSGITNAYPLFIGSQFTCQNLFSPGDAENVVVLPGSLGKNLILNKAAVATVTNQYAVLHPNAAYMIGLGTSFACPLVSAALHLIMEANPALIGNPARVVEILKSSARVLPNALHGVNGGGAGILDVYSAVLKARGVHPQIFTSTAGSEITATFDYDIDNEATEPVAIYYTTNGSTPTTNSSLYQGTPIELVPLSTIKYMAVDSSSTPKTSVVRTEIAPSIPVVSEQSTVHATSGILTSNHLSSIVLLNSVATVKTVNSTGRSVSITGSVISYVSSNITPATLIANTISLTTNGAIISAVNQIIAQGSCNPVAASFTRYIAAEVYSANAIGRASPISSMVGAITLILFSTFKGKNGAIYPMYIKGGSTTGFKFK